tara:strand:+ start:55 stop:510 length:456 start_codon:yes stop_codon:yes gene_type:complete
MNRIIILISIFFVLPWALHADIVVTKIDSHQVGDFTLETLAYNGSKTEKIISTTLREKEKIIFSDSTEGKTSFYPNHQLEIHVTRKGITLEMIEIKKPGVPEFYYKIERVDELYDFTKWPEGVERKMEKGFEIGHIPIPELMNIEAQIQSR